MQVRPCFFHDSFDALAAFSGLTGQWHRIRRIKCDEEKPSCAKCVSTGRTCDGYNKEAVVRCRRTIEAISKNTPDFLSPKSLTPLNDIEQKSLCFFRTRTAVIFAGYSDSGFWDRVILQVSHTEPAVRHAVIALGSLHEYFDSQGTAIAYDLKHESLHFSLQQYTKAIASLNQGFSAGTRLPIEVVLICCALFISIESLQGNYATTARHLLGGSKILSDWLSANDRKTSCLVRDELLPIFIRLNIQVKSLVEYPLPLLELDDAESNSLPVIFSSLQEARTSLYSQMNKVFDFIQTDETFLYNSPDQPDHILSEVFAATEEHNLDETFRFSSGRSPVEIAAAHKERSRMLKILEGWKAVFDAFILQSSTGMGSRELGGAVLLQIHYISAWVALSTCHSRLQSIFDEFTPQFENMVSLSKSLIAASDTEGSSFGRTNFWIDMGVIGPVYLAATRCRDPIVRRQAVQILRLPRREGALDGEAAAMVADRIITLEEAGLPPVKTAEDIPEYARIHVRKVVVDLPNSLVVLSCYNPHAALGGRPKFRVVRVRW